MTNWYYGPNPLVDQNWIWRSIGAIGLVNFVDCQVHVALHQTPSRRRPNSPILDHIFSANQPTLQWQQGCLRQGREGHLSADHHCQEQREEDRRAGNHYCQEDLLEEDRWEDHHEEEVQ
jgi:hypothetical protein